MPLLLVVTVDRHGDENSVAAEFLDPHRLTRSPGSRIGSVDWHLNCVVSPHSGKGNRAPAPPRESTEGQAKSGVPNT
jgi:hypothetical protein